MAKNARQFSVCGRHVELISKPCCIMTIVVLRPSVSGRDQRIVRNIIYGWLGREKGSGASGQCNPDGWSSLLLANTGLRSQPRCSLL